MLSLACDFVSSHEDVDESRCVNAAMDKGEKLGVVAASV
jgi:hypothetical protein